MQGYPAPHSTSSRQIFGYDSELSTVVGSFADPACRGVLLVGPAGVGKTTVINATLTRLDPVATIIRFRGSENALKRNLGIFEILLSQSGFGPSLVPGRALSVIAGLLAQRTEAADALVVLDNADLVDDHSLSVLAQLAEMGRVRLLVAAESVRPPLDLIANLWIAGRMSRVDLEGIDEAAATAMINGLGLLETETRSPTELYEFSHGNPRLLERLIYDGRRPSGTERTAARADPRNRDLIETISLMEAIPHDSLVHLADPSDLDSLAEIGLLTITRGRRAVVTMREPVVSENIRAAIRPSRSLQLFNQFQRVAGPEQLRDRTLFGFVSWALSLGEPQSVAHVVSAAGWANAQGSYSVAADLIRTSGHEEERLALELCRAERALGNFGSARKILDRLIDAAVERSSTMSAEFLSRLASIELRLIDPRHPELLRTEWVRERLTRPSDLGRLDATRAKFELKGGRLAASRRLAESVYRDHACSVRHRLRACAFLGIAEVMAGRIETGLSYIEQARLMLQLPGLTSFDVEDAVPQFFIAYYIAGEWDRARHSLSRLKSSRRLKELTAALVDLRVGEVSSAYRSLDALRLSFNAIDVVDLTVIARSALNCAAMYTGVTTPIVGLDEENPADGSLHSWWSAFETQLLDLQTLAQNSPLSAAEQLYSLGEAYERSDAHALTALAWIEAARLGHQPAVASLPRVAGLVDGRLGHLARSVGDALATEDLAALVAAAREADAFGAVLLCSDLAKSARDQAIAENDGAAAKEARLILGRSLRIIDFNADGGQLRASLTQLEKTLIDGIDAGSTSAVLGKELHLSVRTVEWHLGRIYRRLHVANRQELREVVRAWKGL